MEPYAMPGGHADVIRRNQRVSTLLLVANLALAGITGAAIVLVFVISPMVAAVMAAVFVGVALLASEITSASIGLLAGARRARNQALWVQGRLDALSLAAGIPPPQLGIVVDPRPNAFAYGRRVRGSHVVVSTGLLEQLTDREVEAVLAHEIAHIANRDTRVMSVAFGTFGLLFVIALAATAAMHLGSGNDDGDGPDATLVIALIGLAVVLVAFPAMLISWLLTMAISRDREALADATAVHYLGAPGPLRSALERMAAFDVAGSVATGPIGALCIHSPGKHRSLGSTHPPIGWRINVLRGLEGLGPVRGYDETVGRTSVAVLVVAIVVAVFCVFGAGKLIALGIEGRGVADGFEAAPSEEPFPAPCNGATILPAVAQALPALAGASPSGARCITIGRTYTYAGLTFATGVPPLRVLLQWYEGSWHVVDSGTDPVALSAPALDDGIATRLFRGA